MEIKENNIFQVVELMSEILSKYIQNNKDNLVAKKE